MGLSLTEEKRLKRNAAVCKWQRENKAERSARYARNPRMYTRARERAIAHNLKKFGITPAEYQELLEKQKHVCAICEQPETKLAGARFSPAPTRLRRLAVDHNHVTQNIRGLLCTRCNTVLGLVEDNPDLLNRMVQYL